ncbi:MAG: MotA/TolQ/ExbB proton channel family protein [Candidatus Thiodiazotropha sp.]
MKQAIFTLIALLGCLGAGNALAQSDPLQNLLDQVRESREQQLQQNRTRERRFLETHETRKAQLEAVRQALQEAETRKAELMARHETQQSRLKTLNQQLDERSGTFGELFGVVRQVASESLNLFRNDQTSALHRDDLPILESIATSRSLPSTQRLEALWDILLQRIVRSGEVWRAGLPVIRSTGEEQPGEVIGIGLFNAVSDGRYLRYLPETGRFVELGRQPPPRYQLMAKALETAEAGLQQVAVDPSRGAILSLLVQSPTFSERIRQGGFIGYVILFLGGVGILVTLERLLSLAWVWRRLKHQRQQPEARMDNPLGRLLTVARDHPQISPDALQKHLDEAILRELPALKRGLRLLAIFAAVAPLLGLLGTVTGMIETFQSITLFGTGDPKLMSGGISQALVTTELGLAVAIPLVLVHSLLSGRCNRVIRLLDQESAALVAGRTVN